MYLVKYQTDIDARRTRIGMVKRDRRSLRGRYPYCRNIEVTIIHAKDIWYLDTWCQNASYRQCKSSNATNPTTLSTIQQNCCSIRAPLKCPTLQTFFPLFGDPCPLCFRFESAFCAPPSCSGLCFDTSVFAGETSRGFCYDHFVSAFSELLHSGSQLSLRTSLPSPAVFFSCSGLV
jgi:hypothetical protein